MLVFLIVVIGAAASGDSNRTDAETPLGALSVSLFGTTAPTAVIHASGHPDNLRDSEAIDLDTGQRLPQTTPGVDISFSDKSTNLYATGTRAKIALLPDTGTEDRWQCVGATGWVQKTPIPNIYDLTEGRHICVITDENGSPW